MTKKNALSTKLVFDKELKATISSALKSDKIKDKIQEYIEAKKFTRKIAKEILQEIKAGNETEAYLSDLEKELQGLDQELQDSKVVDDLVEDLS